MGNGKAAIDFLFRETLLHPTVSLFISCIRKMWHIQFVCVCVNLTYNMFTLLSHPHFISTLFEFLRRVALFSSVWVCAVRLFFSSSCTLSCKPKHQCEWHGPFVCSYNFITDKLIF